MEEFTGENCGPCASTNPAFDALIQANPTKIIMLKHQVPIPSAGPIYNGFKTDSDARRSYYGVNSAPSGKIDGAAIDPNGQYPNHPAVLTQNIIDTRAAVQSSFTMNTTHTVSSDLDSIYVTVVITNVDGFTINASSAGMLKLGVSVIEEEINFASAPGTNGEKDFYHVNRMMLPNASGTPLQDAWAVNATQTFNFAVAIPAGRIYNYNEIAVVAYMQDNGTKEVLQASYSAANTVSSNPDASLTNTSAGGSDLCATSFTPTFEIANAGTADITSADVEYSINGGTVVTQSWSGTLTSGQTATVTFPAASLPAATNEFEARVTNLNGGLVDVNSMNNEITPFTVSILPSTVETAPFEVNFEGTQIGNVPTNLILNDNSGRVWVVDNQIASGVSWNLGAYEQSSNSFRFDNYSIQAGTVSELILPKVDISGQSNAKVYFSHAYTQYPNTNDQFEIQVSDDCGQTWSTIWSKSGADLTTTTTSTSQNRLYPHAADWTMNSAMIPASMQGASEIVVKVVSTSDYGNCIYLDNIWVSTTALNVEEQGVAEAILYPNPADRNAEIRFEATQSGSVEVSVVDINGRVVNTVNTEVSTGVQSINLDVAALPAGIYMVRVRQENNVKTLRLSVTH